jgi:hypothetical protein
MVVAAQVELGLSIPHGNIEDRVVNTSPHVLGGRRSSAILATRLTVNQLTDCMRLGRWTNLRQ